MVISKERAGLSYFDAMVKRSLDFVVALLGLILFGWLILIAWLLSTLDARRNGFFTQLRVGRNCQLFHVIKIRTMRDDSGVATTATASGDPRITPLGRIFRKTKIDELPQLINVLVGQMSFVGPRPDVPGFADKLNEEDKIILSIRPGITGPATLKYRNEENLLSRQGDLEAYNRDVLFPDKVKINKKYVANYSLSKDFYYIWKTLVG